LSKLLKLIGIGIISVFSFFCGYFYAIITNSKAQVATCQIEEIYQENATEIRCNDFLIRKKGRILVVTPLSK